MNKPSADYASEPRVTPSYFRTDDQDAKDEIEVIGNRASNGSGPPAHRVIKIALPAPASADPEYCSFGGVPHTERMPPRIQAIQAETDQYVTGYLQALSSAEEAIHPFAGRLRKTIKKEHLVSNLSKRISENGQYHDNPRMQNFMTNLIWWLILFAQLSEFGFGAAEATETNNPLFRYPFESVPLLLKILLVPLAAMTIFFNFHSVDRNKESKTKYKPSIRLGDAVLDPRADAFREAKDEHDKKEGDIKYVIDSEFDPRSENYNPRRVELFLHANRKLHAYKNRHKDYEAKDKSFFSNKVFAFVNNGTFFVTNILGGAANWISVGEALIACAPIARLIAGSATGVFFISVGSVFYMVFAGSAVKEANKNFLGPYNPYRQVGEISRSQSLRDFSRGLLNAIGRGLTFAANTVYLADLLDTGYFVPISSTWKLAILTTAGLTGGFNTLIVRAQATRKTLAPFTKKDYFKQAMCIPDSKLHTDFLEEHRIEIKSPFDFAAIMKMGLQGIFEGATTGGAIYLLGVNYQAEPVYSIPIAGSVFLLRGVLHCLAERSSQWQHALDKQVEAYINSKKEEEFIKYDRNGNQILGKEDSAIQWATTAFTLVDQFFRWSSRIVLAKYLNEYFPPAGPWWMNYVALAMLTLDPQKNEYYFYRVMTEENMQDAINDLRELAGTPLGVLVQDIWDNNRYTIPFKVVLQVLLKYTAQFFVRSLPFWFGNLETHPNYWACIGRYICCCGPRQASESDGLPLQSVVRASRNSSSLLPPHNGGRSNASTLRQPLLLNADGQGADTERKVELSS